MLSLVLCHGFHMTLIFPASQALYISELYMAPRTWKICHRYLTVVYQAIEVHPTSYKIANFALICCLLRSCPQSDMTMRACCYDAVFFESKPAHRVLVNDFGLGKTCQQGEASKAHRSAIP